MTVVNGDWEIGAPELEEPADEPWRFALLRADTGQLLSDLPDATSRKATFKLSAATELSFNLSGDDPAAYLLGELTTDVYVAWGNRLLARCRVGATSDTLDEDAHNIEVAALDYLALLDRRYVQQGGGTVTDDLTDIAWYIINRTQHTYPWAGGDFGITRGLTAVTGTATYTFEDGKKIGEAVTELSQVYPAFDFEIDAALRFNVWKQRGAQRDFALEYGANVSRVTRQIDPERYANFVRQSGADGVPAAVRAAPDLANRPEGRIEAQEGNTDLHNATLVGWAADAYLQRHGTMVATYQCRLNPAARWDPTKLWLGDLCWLVVRSGRLDVRILERVFEISVEIGDDGQTDVDIGFGGFQEDLLALVRAVPARLEQINRR